MYFKIGDETVAFLTGNILVTDESKDGLDMLSNNIRNDDFFNCSNAIIDYCECKNVSSTNLYSMNACIINSCLVNVSIVNAYIDPAIIDNCCFVYNVYG